jgi:NADPH:quinone reductase-like Zn-dependent oxidoreductase
MEFAGIVESVGKAVTRFGAGDQVFGVTAGAHAEYTCLPEDGKLAIKSVNMTLQEAAAVLFGGVSALYFLRKAKIRAGQKVLIYGASGIGADEVVDYTKDDFSRADRVYDIVFDTVGMSGSFVVTVVYACRDVGFHHGRRESHWRSGKRHAWGSGFSQGAD